MKTKLFIVILAIFALTACKSHKNEPENLGEVTIKGVVGWTSNPCLTDPCIPGVELALFADKTYYLRNVNIREEVNVDGENYITVMLWDGHIFTSGDSVSVKGTLSRRFDIHNEEYYTLNVKEHTFL